MGQALETDQHTLASDRARAVVTQFYDIVWNACDTGHMYAIAHENFTFRGSLGPELHGITPFIEYVDLVTTALGDYRCDVEALIVQENRAFAKVLFSGIHRGELLGCAPTNKRVSWYGAALFTLHEGRILDLWILGDVDGLRRQLGTTS